jgi:hypothetical protein
VDLWLHVFLTSLIDGNEWSALGSSHFTLGETFDGRFDGTQGRSRYYGRGKISLAFPKI